MGEAPFCISAVLSLPSFVSKQAIISGVILEGSFAGSTPIFWSNSSCVSESRGFLSVETLEASFDDIEEASPVKIDLIPKVFVKYRYPKITRIMKKITPRNTKK